MLVAMTGANVISETNGASPVAPTRASPSPPASANGAFALDQTLSAANGQQQTPQTITAKSPKAAAALANDMNIVRRKLTGYVGFANLPNQWHRKSVRKGFNFNVMVVGTWHLAGVGRSR
jgi:septin 7